MNIFQNPPKQYHLAQCITIPLRAAPIPTALLLLFTLVSAGIPTLNIGATTLFINTAMELLSDGGSPQRITIPILCVALITAFNIFSEPLKNFIRVRLLIRLRKCLRESLLHHRALLDYQHIENTETWDLIERIGKTPEDKFLGMLDSLLSLCILILSTAGVLAVLITQVWWAALLILAISIPLMRLSIKGGKQNYDANREVSKINRVSNYLSEILMDREHVLERTMFGYNEKLNQKYLESYEKSRKFTFRIERKWFIRMKAGGIAAALISIFVVFILINPVVSGVITVGMFISLVNAVFGMIQSMTWQLTTCIDSLTRNREYMKDLTKFAHLSTQPDAVSPPVASHPAFERLEFRHVTFRYPGTERDILSDLSFVLERGKNYSFVGINGAGKTTITKLITGLYRDYQGEILLNGKDLKTYSLPEIKAYFSGVFQDFARYFITCKENIALGNINGDEKELFQAAELAGIHSVIKSLPKGYDTPLGKILEGGMDLSGGEWQRIAMARSIVNPADVKILDEPTAALDPIGESEVYENFRQISKDCTTLFISHRLGSTLLADTIFVLDGGHIAESGSHGELMERGGIYAEMFESQRSWYH